MTHLKNTDIANTLGVSKVSVFNWAKNAELGKNDLQIELVNETVKIIDSRHNWLILEKLANRSKNYNRHIIKTNPDEKFYEIFNETEQVELIRDLQQKEIDLKYYYFFKGATFWDTRYKKGVSKIPDITSKLIQLSTSQITHFTNNKNVNVIDIGCGNGHPVKQVLDTFNCKSYLPVDISQNMLDICVNNVSEWFPKLTISGHKIDIQNSSLAGLLTDTKADFSQPNLLLFIGNTICNYSDRVRILQNIVASMSSQDLMLLTFSFDNDSSRGEISYIKDPNNERAWLPRLLGINVDDCTEEVIFNSEANCKQKTTVLDQDYDIEFNFGGRNIEVNLSKGDKIVRWRHYLLTIEGVFDELKEAGLSIAFMNVIEDEVMVGCKIK